MTTKRNEDSSLMNKTIDGIKGSGKGGPNQVDPAQKKVRFSIWSFVASASCVLIKFPRSREQLR
jgi:hypothetical protein